MRLIHVKRALIFDIGQKPARAINAPEADQIARANDCVYAENFVAKYKDRILELDDDMKINPRGPI